MTRYPHRPGPVGPTPRHSFGDSYAPRVAPLAAARPEREARRASALARAARTHVIRLLAAAVALLMLTAGSASSEADRISRALDRLYRSESSQGTMVMEVTTPNYQRTLEMEIWTRGMDATLVRILSPKKERGTATLKKGPEMWNYLPKIKKTIRVPPSMMMSSWMGSDFTNDDMVRESSWQGDYSATLAGSAPRGQKCIDYRAKRNAAVAWDRVLVCVDESHYYPLRQEFYDEKGRKARVMTFDQVKVLDGRRIPTRMTLTPLTEDKRGNRTVVTYKELRFDVPVSDSLFSLTSLKRGR